MMLSLEPALVSLSVLFAFYCVSKYFQRPSLPFPPGPKGLPILGVTREHPKTEFWKTYAEWGRQYGERGLISFHVLGRRMVVVNSASVAEDLLVRKSGVYSDRPFPTMAGQLMKREKSMFYISYNERYKAYRKMMHQSFNAAASQGYWELQEHEARVMVNNIAKSPQNLDAHVRRNAAAIIMKIAYGYTIDEDNDHFVALAEESMRVGSLGGAPGRWLVDSFPILRHVPDWFPGAGFKRQAKAWSHQLYTQSLEPHQFVKDEMAAGRAISSFVSRLLTSEDGKAVSREQEDLVLWTSGAIYAGGADTTVSAVKTFFFTMMLHPEIQKRAQEEVDSVIGLEHRLPTIHDRPLMAYIDCILKEVLRWGTVSPIGLFHCTAKDDEYAGHSIPAKTTIITNIWGMLHDESVYPEPFRFNPDRFVEDGKTPPQRDPRDLAFGFGRRACPGQHLAEAAVFIQMATALATLDIRKPVDSQGEVIEPEIAFTTAIVSHVKLFKAAITPRSETALAMVQQDLAAVA